MAGTHFFGITADKKIVPCSLIADHPDIPKVYFENAESFGELSRQMDAVFAGIKNRLGGICGTCETAVLAGDIEHRDDILTDEEKRDGRTMMVCVSRCAGRRLVLYI